MRPRTELAICAALLGLYAALRVAAAGPLAFDLLDPEELLNLRLAWQRAEGHPIGALGQYWYTGAGGSVGAGPLVLSLLYVPLGWFAELDFGATRAMALAWALLGAASLAGLGRHLLGPGGAAASLVSALALPPSWLAWTLTANGNYIEAASLTLFGAWLAATAERPARALGAGAVLGFSAWFCVSAVGPAGVLVAATLWRLRADRAAAAALIGGAVLGWLPLATALEPLSQATSPVGADAVGDLLRSVLSAPTSWPAVVASSLAGVPLLEYRAVAAEDWAPAWLIRVEPLWKAGLWAAFAGAAVAGLRGPHRPLILAGVISAIAVPVGLTVLGVGPEGGPVDPLYFYDGRRAALVLPLLALGAAAVGLSLARRAPPFVAGVLALATLAALPSLVLVRGGEAPPDPFRPARYLLCPAEAPVERDSVCVDALWEDQVATLEALVERPELEAVDPRRQALRGFGSVERDEEHCELAGPPGSEAGWFGVGAALGSGCSDRVEPLCAGEAACLEGAAFARGLSG